MFIEVPDIKIDRTVSPKKQRFKSTKRYPSFGRNVREYFSEYAGTTSLHGLQYLGDRKRTKFERIMWFLILSLSLLTCIFLIKKTYDKWNLTPVIVTFAHSPTPVWKIPFPAVTVCPETKSSQTIFNFTKIYRQHERDDENVTDANLKRLGDIALLCEQGLYTEGNLTTTEDVLEFMRNVAPPLPLTIMGCKSTTLGERCTKSFVTMVTEEGICYSFNALDRDDMYTTEMFHSTDFTNHQNNSTDWSLEDGYSKSAGLNTYPKRTMSAGAEGGLMLLFAAFEQDLDYLCKGPVQGFRVLLHHPGEIPRVSMQYFRVPFTEDIMVAVKPDMITTSSSLRDYDPHKRGCYFSDERQLRFYKNYTQQNCQMECLTNITLQRCRCVSFYMPRRNTTSICGSGSLNCTENAKTEVVTGHMEGDFNNNSVGCDCLPSCTTLSYSAETSQSRLDWLKFLQAFDEMPDDNITSGLKLSRVSIFFKEMQFITSERNELYGITDFLANCGGLLGLFIGFSFVSLVETLYFLSIRLFINWRKFGRHYWSASENLLDGETYGYQKQSV